MFQKIASFFVPIRLKKVSTAHSGEVEINLINGRKVLDTAVSNYSFGSLQEVLRAGLASVHFNDSFSRILVLGSAGGSIVETIRFDFESNAFIELVDFDEAILNIAKQEFNILKYQNINMVCADAMEYVIHNSHPFDLIIVDLFIGNKVPEAFCTNEFLALLINNLSPESGLIFNTISKTFPEKRFAEMQHYFEQSNFTTQKLAHIEGGNDVLVATRN